MNINVAVLRFRAAAVRFPLSHIAIDYPLFGVYNETAKRGTTRK